MKNFYLTGVCALLQLALTASVNAATQSDSAKEQRWSEQIVDQLIDGEDVWLEARKHRFLTIYTPAEQTDAITGNSCADSWHRSASRLAAGYPAIAIRVGREWLAVFITADAVATRGC